MDMLSGIQPLLDILMTLGVIAAAVYMFRRGWSKETAETQRRLIEALEKEVALLRREVENLKNERSTQDRTISTIRYALKQYGMKIIINGDFVTVHDGAGTSKVTRIHQPPKTVASEEDDTA